MASSSSTRSGNVRDMGVPGEVTEVVVVQGWDKKLDPMWDEDLWWDNGCGGIKNQSWGRIRSQPGRDNELWRGIMSLRWCGIINGIVWDNEPESEWDNEMEPAQDNELDSLAAENRTHRVPCESMEYPNSRDWL